MRYSERSKRTAVRKVVVDGRSRSDVAREYGVSASVIRSWIVNLLPALSTTDDLTFGDSPDNSAELLNERIADVVKEYLLYGAHPLTTEDDSDEIWDDSELYNIRLSNGDTIDCEELASEMIDGLKRYLAGQPVLQSVPVKRAKS